MTHLPFVSVVIPCRNERGFIEPCLDSLLASQYPHERLEILVADGMSNDGTRESLQAYAARHPQIRLIDNPKKIVPTGLNQAIKAARGEVIVRMDAHSEYARDYIHQCVAVLAETGAANVGGAWQTKAAGYLQEAIALAFHSPFSAGGAVSRDVDYEGEADTVIYGCWRKQTLLDAGLFDEELVRNQDDELSLRITRGGGKIWQSARIRSWYSPRPSLKSLFRQYSQYGYWKVRVIQKHKLPASPRHLVPGAWVGSTLALAALSFISPIALWLLIVETAFYVAANLTATALTCRSADKLKFLPILPVVFATYHFGYGYGFLRGILDFVLLRRGGSESFNSLSRKTI
jgi:glycosyltransferase involved in cell wall biosynthesis